MQTRGIDEFGSVGLVGGALDLNLGNLVGILKVFVPAISSSGTTGYSAGLAVEALGHTGEDSVELSAGVGCAGGYVGAGYGAQIGIADDASTEGVWIRRLAEVRGVDDIGGFVGRLGAASVLSIDTETASDSFLQSLLDKIIVTPTKLIKVLDATMATVKHASVTASDEAWGFVVDGTWDDGGTTRYARHAGGFAGAIEASVLGQRQHADDTLVVRGLRSVVGGHYAGGFFGIAQVGSVAQVGGDSGTGDETHILDLISLGNVSLLDAFRSYVYHASVEGVADGITVYAHLDAHEGDMGGYVQTGGAGGFGGGLFNGTVENSSVTNLNYVSAHNYAAGFIGFAGKDGGVSVEGARITSSTPVGRILEALGLNLSTDLELLDIAGATISNCSASGFGEGFIAEAVTPMVPIPGVVDEADLTGSCAAGFVGFADTTQISDCQVGDLKRATSPQIAGGFVGRTSLSYLAGVDVSSGLTAALVDIVDLLIRILYLPEAERAELINADGAVLGLKLLADGDLLYVNLLGLKISVSLIHSDPEYGGADAALVTIGSSTIKLPADENGIRGETPDLSVNLIEGNRTAIRRTSVTGIDDGYDVFGGGASDEADGSGDFGYAGGYVGLNEGGLISHSAMALCDVVRAAQGKVGPFAGHTNPYSRPIDYLEGTENSFSVYRADSGYYTQARLSSGVTSPAQAMTVGDADYNRYEFAHISQVANLAALEGAMQVGVSASADLGAYASSAKAVLMDDVALPDNDPGDTPKPADMKDPCDESFDLTVSKRWDDLLNLAGKRPETITVHVQQVDVGANPPDALVAAGTAPAGTTMRASFDMELDGTMSLIPFSLAWTERREDLPVAFWTEEREEEGIVVPSEVHYLKYYVSEVSVDGYTTSYSVNGDTAHIVITNVYSDSLLPELGGAGTYLFVLAGIVLLAIGIRRMRRGMQGEGG